MKLSADAFSQALDSVTLSSMTPRQRVDRVLNEVLAEERQTIVPGDLVTPAQRVNGVLRSYGVEFELSEHSNRTVIRLVDRESGEVIREIPPKEMIAISERLDYLRGLLIALAI